MNLTSTKGFKKFLARIAEYKTERDVRLDRKPKTTVSIMGVALIAYGLSDDPDVEAVLAQLKVEAERRGPEGEEAQLMLRHWRQAQEDADAYIERFNQDQRRG